MSVIEIQSEVARLSEKERAKLAAWLLESLPEHGDDDAINESIAEADRRREELESKRSELLNESEFWSSVSSFRNK